MPPKYLRGFCAVYEKKALHAIRRIIVSVRMPVP